MQCRDEMDYHDVYVLMYSSEPIAGIGADGRHALRDAVNNPWIVRRIEIICILTNGGYRFKKLRPMAAQRFRSRDDAETVIPGSMKIIEAGNGEKPIIATFM